MNIVKTFLSFIINPITFRSFSFLNIASHYFSGRACFSFGGLVGPPVGSVLYHFYDFCLPSFFAALLLFICGVASYSFLSLSSHSSLSSNSSTLSPPSSPHNKSSHHPSRSSSSSSLATNSHHQFDPLAYFKFILKVSTIIKNASLHNRLCYGPFVEQLRKFCSSSMFMKYCFSKVADVTICS